MPTFAIYKMMFSKASQRNMREDATLTLGRALMGHNSERIKRYYLRAKDSSYLRDFWLLQLH